MCSWHMTATDDRDEQGIFVENEMGNEQLEAGNIAGERTCWRISSSAVVGQNETIVGAMSSPRLVKAGSSWLTLDGWTASVWTQLDQQQSLLKWIHKNGKKTIAIIKKNCSTQSRSKKEKEMKSFGVEAKAL